MCNQLCLGQNQIHPRIGLCNSNRAIGYELVLLNLVIDD